MHGETTTEEAKKKAELALPPDSMGRFLLQLHKQIEGMEGRDISRGVMARRLGVAQRTYTEYLLGNIDPLAMRALLRLLMQLPDRAILEVIRSWQHNDPQLPWAREQEELNPPMKRGPKPKKVLGLP